MAKQKTPTKAELKKAAEEKEAAKKLAAEKKAAAKASANREALTIDPRITKELVTAVDEAMKPYWGKGKAASAATRHIEFKDAEMNRMEAQIVSVNVKTRSVSVKVWNLKEKSFDSDVLVITEEIATELMKG